MPETPSSIKLSGDASEDEILEALRNAGIGNLDDSVRKHVQRVQADMRSAGPGNECVVIYSSNKYFAVLPD